jgi:hypothetical protein
MDLGYSNKGAGVKFYDSIMDESMAMVGYHYKDGDTILTLAWKICGFSVVEKVKTTPYRRHTIYKTSALTMAEAILYSRTWFRLIDDYVT